MRGERHAIAEPLQATGELLVHLLQGPEVALGAVPLQRGDHARALGPQVLHEQATVELTKLGKKSVESLAQRGELALLRERVVSPELQALAQLPYQMVCQTIKERRRARHLHRSFRREVDVECL